MIHFSCDKIKKIYHVEQENYFFYKPNGLWYATEDEWLKYYLENIKKIKDCKFIYKLKIKYTNYKNTNKNKILKITTESIFDKFTLKYGLINKSKYSNDKFFVLINWFNVEKDYGGIEIIKLITSRIKTNDVNIVNKYNKKFKFTNNNDNNVELIFWQYSLDIGSGCVWNPKAIKNIEQIYKI